MKLKATIISLISIGLVGLTAILLYCFWPAIKGTVDKSKYYSQEELQESYDKGFEDGCKTETELTGQVKYYKELVDEYYIQVNTLNDEITMLTNNNRDYTAQISKLETQKTNLQNLVDDLKSIKSENETTISQLNTQIDVLTNEVAVLKSSGLDKDETIAQKNKQIENLQSTVSQLQKTNELNIETITNLNNQIGSLNTQISDMTLQIQNNSTNVIALNNKIAELEKSVSYYEQYISNLENEEQVVATFEFNGSVYNIQIVNKNSTVSVVNPTSTDYVIFNYWTLNGEQIDLSTYQITSNVKFVADVTYNYDVKFMIDETEYENQIVVKDGFAVLPNNPTKTGYEFDGWTLNGVDIVNPETITISQNTTYIAKFTKVHTVTFMYEDEIYSTQNVRNNECSTSVSVENTDYKVFNGWTLNGAIIDISTHKIVSDTTFIADLSYYYDVKFMVNNTVYNSQIIKENQFFVVPENPHRTNYIFLGWSINDVIVEDLSSYVVTHDLVLNAEFKYASFNNSDFTVTKLSSSNSTIVKLYNEELQSIISNGLANSSEFNITFNFTYKLKDSPESVTSKFTTTYIGLSGNSNIKNKTITYNSSTLTVDSNGISYYVYFSSTDGISITFNNATFKYLIISETAILDSLNIERVWYR